MDANAVQASTTNSISFGSLGFGTATAAKPASEAPKNIFGSVAPGFVGGNAAATANSPQGGKPNSFGILKTPTFTAANPAASQSVSLFGTSTAQPSSGGGNLFSSFKSNAPSSTTTPQKPAGFGAPAAFGAPATSAFGAPPAFDASATTGGFGSAPAFGSTPAFGSVASSTPSFGTTSAFGASASSGGGLFGAAAGSK